MALVYTPRLYRAAAIMAAVTACSLLLYGIFLLEAVGSTARRAHAEREITSVTSELSAMQARYLGFTKEVSPERAEELGFVKSTEVSTVYAAEARPLSLVAR